MKRKIKFIYVFAFAIGVLATSCVDDSESASVSAIRDAKAEQLTAEAELMRADAATKSIIAEAQAELTRAQAEFQRAEAELKRAEAEFQKAEVNRINAQTEIEKALAEVELEQAKIEKEKAAEGLKVAQEETNLRLKQLEIQMEQALVEAEIAMINLQKELESAKVKTTDPLLASAIASYQSLILQINSLKADIGRDNITLAYMESQLPLFEASEGEALAYVVRNKELSVVAENKKIDNLKKSLEAWNTIAKDFTALETTINEKVTEYNKLISGRVAASNEVAIKEEAYVEAEALHSAFEALITITDRGITKIRSVEEIGLLITETESTITKIQKQIADSTGSLTASKGQVVALYNLWQVAISETETAQNTLDDAVAILDAANENYYSLVGQGASQDAIDAAQEAVDEAQVKKDEAQVKKDEALAKEDEAQAAYEANLTNITTLEKGIEDLKKSLENQQNTLSGYIEAKEGFDGDSNRLQTLYDAMTTAEKAKVAAEDAYVELQQQVDDLADLIRDLNVVKYNSEVDNIEAGNDLDGGDVTQATMTAIEDKIVDVEGRIIAAENNVNAYGRDIEEAKADKTRAIALFEKDIETLKNDILANESMLEIKEAQAAILKTEIASRQ